MTSTAFMINDLLENLEEEDYEMAISFIQYLSDKRKKKRASESREIMEKIQNIFAGDKGWDSEEQMIQDMAAFRKERIGL